MTQNLLRKTIYLTLMLLMLFLLVSCNSARDTPVPPTSLPEAQEPQPVEPEPTPLPPTEPVLPTPSVFTSVKSLVGMEIGDRQSLEQANLAVEAGALWIRRNGLFWADIEPVEGQRQWEKAENLEAQLKALGAHGLETILIVRSTPAWAQRNPGISCGPVHPDHLQAFGQFMYEAVTRYSQPPYNIKYWELGNEPDVAVGEVAPNSQYGCWGNPADPYFDGGYYAEMLKVVYPQIKAADPEAQVLVGGLLLGCDPNHPPVNQNGETQDCTSSRFLEGILLNGGGDYFDGVSFHAYDYYYPILNAYGNPNWPAEEAPAPLMPVTVAKTQFLRNLLEQYGHPDKFLINSETALICGRDGKEEACQTEQFQTAKAHYLVQSYVIAYTQELHANIWYSLFGWRASGLTTSDLTPYPVLTAYQFAAGQFSQAIFMRQLDYPGLLAYEFQTPEKTFWVVWSADRLPVQLTLPTAPQAIFDTFGESVAPAQTLTVEAGPLYLEWK